MVSQQIIQDSTPEQMKKESAIVGEEEIQQESAENSKNINDAEMIETSSVREQQAEEVEEVKEQMQGNFDPDEDGFVFGVEKASALHKNINVLQFIRKILIPNNFRQFESAVEPLKE